MRTLVINCYRENAETKIRGYLEQAARHSEPYEERWDVVEPAYNMDSFSSVVISGSQWLLSKEEVPNPLTEFVRGLKMPTLGICFGHQLFARVFGAEVLSGELIERYETVIVTEKVPLFQDLSPEAEFLESHREYVDFHSVERAGWRVVAQSASCAVEAMHHPTRPIYGVQFHPERSGPNGGKLFDNFYNRIVKPFRGMLR